MVLQDLLDNVKPQAGASPLALDLDEFLKELALLRLRDSLPHVGNLDGHPLPLPAGGDPDEAAPGSVADRVAEEVIEDLANLVAVGLNEDLLVMSSITESDILEKATKAGADAFLPKPFDMKELLSQVGRLLS